MFQVCLVIWIGLGTMGSLLIGRNPTYIKQEEIRKRIMKVEAIEEIN